MSEGGGNKEKFLALMDVSKAINYVWKIIKDNFIVDIYIKPFSCRSPSASTFFTVIEQLKVGYYRTGEVTGKDDGS